VGFGPLQSLVSLASARSPLHRTGPFKKEPDLSRTYGSASREVLAPADTTTPGAPSPSRTSLRSSVRDEDRQTLVGAVLRVLAPLDGSGWLAARSRSFGPRRSPWPPTLRGLLSCRSRPWSAPPELSLPGEPHPLSRAVASLRVRSPTAAGAGPAGSSRPLSPGSRQLVATCPPEGGPGTHEPGRRFPAVASPAASTHRSGSHVPSTSHRHWAHR
jgi:hypothetical protein